MSFITDFLIQENPFLCKLGPSKTNVEITVPTTTCAISVSGMHQQRVWILMNLSWTLRLLEHVSYLTQTAQVNESHYGGGESFAGVTLALST